MRKYIKLVFVISIILVSGLVFIIGIYIPSVEESKKKYIATDDTYYSGADRMETVNGNEGSLIAGRYETNTSSAVYHTFIKFDLTDKPRHWEKCEFSFYVYEYVRKFFDIRFMLLPYNWNEEMAGYEIKGNLPYTTINFYWYHSLGLQEINITEYIQDSETITLMIWGDCYYKVGSHYVSESNYIWMYSKEANVDKAWLPQLIWS